MNESMIDIDPDARDPFEQGTCSVCGGRAERGPSTGWWHLNGSCFRAWGRSDRIIMPDKPVQFVPMTSEGDLADG